MSITCLYAYFGADVLKLENAIQSRWFTSSALSIMKTRLFKSLKTENFQIKKKQKKKKKKNDIFHISVQSIDCEYSFEPPR